MPRWEPNARERLERAALALFLEQGYDATTVTGIADQAGLTKSTFFRHFADKREVLFGGQDQLITLMTDAVTQAPPEASTTRCVLAALEAAGRAFTPERHELAGQRRQVVAANSELQERELLKRARLGNALTGALRDRGADEITARVAGELGVLAFSIAFARWATPGNTQPYAELAAQALREAQASAASLGA